jgi:hypothetical protein
MSAPRVTIAGGGPAGLAAALRLAERGYQVTLYERKPMLGGNLASRFVDERVYLDIYPHMYLNWYHNFWGLLADATKADRDQLFRPVQGVKLLRAGEYPRYTGLTNPYRPRNLLKNMLGGPVPPADLYLFLYAAADLLAEDLHPTVLLDAVSVNGFLHARPYMTERAAALFNDLIIDVWGIPSYLAAADDYRDFVEYSVADPSPPFWLARGSARDQVIVPLEDKLKALHVKIVTSVEVVSATCAEGRVRRIGVRDSRWDAHTQNWEGSGEVRTEEVDELILAVPPAALTRLVRAGEPGQRIVEALPRIAEVSQLRSQQVPLVNLYLKRWLKLPPEPVGLSGSRFALAFTDISQTWQSVADFEGTASVLALSASDPFGLPGTSPADDAMAMLREFASFIDIDVGEEWGESDDIDWERTSYESNKDAQLFVNETGSDLWRPKARCDELPNLSFAGDFSDNRIGMATLESAVTGGLEAAAAIVARRGGTPVAIREPRALPRALWVWLRFACMPYAASASMWSKGGDLVTGALRRLQRWES